MFTVTKIVGLVFIMRHITYRTKFYRIIELEYDLEIRRDIAIPSSTDSGFQVGNKEINKSLALNEMNSMIRF